MPEVRYVSEHSLRGTRGPRLLTYLFQRGADEFTISVLALADTPAPFADAFEDELARFEKPMSIRRVLTSPAPDDLVRLVRLWSFNLDSIERLLSFFDEGLFHSPAGPDGWLEDLAVYRAGELVLGLVTHEREGVLRLTAEEFGDVAALDVPFEHSAESISY